MTPAPPSEPANDLHRRALVADFHSHALLGAYFLRRDPGRRHAPPRFYHPLPSQMDLPRAREGGCDLVTFSTYVPANPLRPGTRDRATLRQMDLYARMLRAHADRVEHAASPDAVADIVARGKTAAALAVEGGHAIERDVRNLDAFAERGVVYLTLTHFLTNRIACACHDRWSPLRGLSEFGREVVDVLERLGILPDVAHAADGAIADVLRHARGPVISSHTGLRRFCPLSRNLTDDHVRAIAATGGLVGIIFWPWYLEHRGVRTSVDRLVEHILHVCELVGPEHVCLGSDLDAPIWPVRGIRDVRDLPRITERLLARGVAPEDVSRILGGNILRVWRLARSRAGLS